MKWYGLTGGIGSGKTTVAGMLRERGVSVIDADRVAREVVEPGSPTLDRIRECFGDEVFDGAELDRQKMAAVVFSDEQKLGELEQILHPAIQGRVLELRDEFAEKGAEVVIYDVPLLFEKKLTGFDGTILVYCSEDQQIERLRLRESWPDEEITRRLKSQIPIETKRELADYVVDNSRSQAELADEVEKLFQNVLPKGARP